MAIAAQPVTGSVSSVVVRLAAERDVSALITLTNRLAQEASLLFVVPVDPKTGPDDVRQYLRATAASGNSSVLVAAEGDRLVGLVTATGGIHPAKRAAVEIGIGVIETHQGRGIGSALMAGLEDWARTVGIRRLQLPVVTSNEPAIALYRKSGFTIEGTLRDSVRVADRYRDQYMMAKLLG